MSSKSETGLRIAIGVAFAIGLLLAGLSDATRESRAASYSMGRGPAIVLVHGLGGSIQDWLPTVRLLARRHRVELVELPGHGESPMPEPFGLARAAAALDRVLADENEPVVLVGHSLGGMVATAEALARPERVRALVLVETALKPQFEGEDRQAMMQALETDFDGLLRSAYESFGRDSVQGHRRYLEAARQDPAVMKRWIRLALTDDLSPRVVNLQVPVLAVLSDRSWPRGEPWAETARALGYQRIPDLRPMRMEDCGHFVMLDRPAELAQAIDSFGDRREDEPVAAAVPARP